ncbi:RNA polymerase subunit sigma [Aliidiomarina taiwanensis]|uniref:RNA polymerase subunit sigma n=1 Tax=Aliidiomarina taiwanensis TaxID=946228 RepID=A0A432X0V6_9GAMM|nr:RNA polymerase sigma factor [Aliidiomarina taiwanensis]RUO39782.1 RNA polymerase subunit sigma [Aliidiomarina taiwanensis]
MANQSITTKRIAGVSEYGRLSDMQLAHCILAEDLMAFEFLMRCYNQRLYRTARSILQSEQEAEEAVQDAYIKAYGALSSFRAEAQLATWLTRIVVNEAYMRLRKQQRRTRIATESHLEAIHTAEPADMQETFAMYTTPTETPEQAAHAAQMRRLIEENIDKLPDDFRSVFVLRALEDLSVTETSDCLGIPEATVRTRYFRAKNLLRAALAREFDSHWSDAFGFAGERCHRIVGAVLKRVRQDKHQK